VLKVDFNFAIGSDLTGLSRIHVGFSGGAPDAAELVSFCETLSNAYGTDLKSLAQANTILESVSAIDLTSDLGAQGSYAGAVAGTRSGAELPGDACMVIGYEIVRRYRGGHPRGYWPFGVGADLLSPQAWTSSFITAVDTGWTNFIPLVTGAGWSGAGTLSHDSVSYFAGFTAVENPVTHRYRNIPNVRVTPVVDFISSYAYRTRLGSQRRRLGRA
jgi:hypothetical protein